MKLDIDLGRFFSFFGQLFILFVLLGFVHWGFFILAFLTVVLATFPLAAPFFEMIVDYLIEKIGGAWTVVTVVIVFFVSSMAVLITVLWLLDSYNLM